MPLRVKKNLPSKNPNDRRYVRLIDELRVMAWHRFVSQATGLSTNYQLDKKFGGGQAAWKAYGGGRRQPNAVFLESVETIVQGSYRVFTKGPKPFNLWVAMDTQYLNELQLITEFGRPIDKAIVNFRLRCMSNEIKVYFPDDIDPYEVEIALLTAELQKVLDDDLADKASQVLLEAVDPYRIKAKSDAEEDFYDFVIESRYNRMAYEEMLREENFHALKMQTGKNKGQRRP